MSSQHIILYIWVFLAVLQAGRNLVDDDLSPLLKLLILGMAAVFTWAALTV